MDHLAARLDVVVAAVDLDQTGVVQHAVLVIVQAAVLRHDAVLRGIFDLRIEHLAVIGKGVAALGHETVGLGDPVAAAVDHLAARLDVVVAAVDLDQASVGAQAVLVIVQAAVLRHDAVLLGIFDLRIDHLAVIGKGVAALGHEAVGLADPVIAAVDDLAARLDVVVAAVDLDQTGVVQHAVLVIVQAAVLRHDAVLLQDELAVRVEGVFACLETGIVHSLAVVLLAGHQLAAALGVVVAAVQLEHAHVDADAVNVVVLGIIFRDNAVLELLIMEDHTVFIEVVAPLGQQTVGLVRRNPEVVSACGQDVLHGFAVRAKVVVQVVAFCILNLGQALVLYDLAILQPIGIIAIDAQAVFADRLELGGVSDIAGDGGELLVPTGKRVGVIRGLGLGGRAIIGRHVAICINLRRLHTVDDPGDGRAGLGDDGAGLQQLTADRAVSVAGVAVLGEGRVLPTADLLRVTRSGDDLLCNNDLVADGAVLALGQTSLRARRLDSRVNDLRVTRSGDDLLCNNDLIADGAVLALGQASLCARRLDSRVDDLRVTLGGDNRTVGELHTAVRTIGIAGIPVLGASGSFHNAKHGGSVPACCGELRRIRHIAGDGSDLFVPTAECIRILRVGRAGRIGRAVGRHRAVGHRIFPQRGAVPVDPLDRVGTELRGIHGAVSDVAHDGRHLRSPAGEAVGILGIGGFGGNTAIGRHGAVVHLFGLEHSAVIVFPGHGALIGLGIHHASLCVELVIALRHQAVGRLDPVRAIFDHGAQGLELEVIIVPIHIAQAGLGILNAVFHPIGAAVPVIEAVDMLLPDAVAIEGVDHVFAALIHAVKARGGIFAGAEIIPVAVNRVPLLRGPGAGPHILRTIGIVNQVAAN